MMNNINNYKYIYGRQQRRIPNIFIPLGFLGFSYFFTIFKYKMGVDIYVPQQKNTKNDVSYYRDIFYLWKSVFKKFKNNE